MKDVIFIDGDEQIIYTFVFRSNRDTTHFYTCPKFHQLHVNWCWWWNKFKSILDVIDTGEGPLPCVMGMGRSAPFEVVNRYTFNEITYGTCIHTSC